MGLFNTLYFWIILQGKERCHSRWARWKMILGKCWVSSGERWAISERLVQYAGSPRAAGGRRDAWTGRMWWGCRWGSAVPAKSCDCAFILASWVPSCSAKRGDSLLPSIIYKLIDLWKITSIETRSSYYPLPAPKHSPILNQILHNFGSIPEQTHYHSSSLQYSPLSPTNAILSSGIEIKRTSLLFAKSATRA